MTHGKLVVAMWWTLCTEKLSALKMFNLLKRCSWRNVNNRMPDPHQLLSQLSQASWGPQQALYSQRNRHQTHPPVNIIYVCKNLQNKPTVKKIKYLASCKDNNAIKGWLLTKIPNLVAAQSLFVKALLRKCGVTWENSYKFWRQTDFTVEAGKTHFLLRTQLFSVSKHWVRFYNRSKP